jgi:hypothetical protein
MDHNFITPDQFAFIKSHSTDMCLHCFIDGCLQNIDDNLLTVTSGCMLDIKTDFDTIEHAKQK